MNHAVFCAENGRGLNGSADYVARTRIAGSVGMSIGYAVGIGALFKRGRPVKIIVFKEGRAVKHPVIKAHVDTLIAYGGEAVNDLTPNKRDTAMVFQSYALLPHINVFDNVAYGLKLRKFPKEVIREKVLNILKLVEMEGMESRMTNQLSGGQQQRVALARALVLEPGVLLFDEPLSNLDAKLRVTMRTEIRKIQQKVGITAVYVTHDQSEAMAISDNIIIMSRGHMEQMGSPRDVYYKPASKFVADFIGEANFIPVKLEKKHDGKADIDVFGAKLTVLDYSKTEEGGEATLVIRPEAVKLADSGQIGGEVSLSTFMGAYQYYRLLVGGQEIQITDYNPVNRKIYEFGDKAFLDFDPSGVYIL